MGEKAGKEAETQTHSLAGGCSDLHPGLLEAQVVVLLLLPDAPGHLGVDFLHLGLPPQGRLLLDGLAAHLLLRAPGNKQRRKTAAAAAVQR